MLALLGSATSAYALACTSVATGNWGVAGTWTSAGNCNRVPTAADTVTIAAGHTVTVNVATANVLSVTVNATGILTQSSALNDAGVLSVAGTLTSSAAMAITGATNVTGTLNIDNSNVARTFTGLVTVTGGNWNNTGTRAVTFQGGITNNGTFTAGTGTQTFNTNAQAIGGANPINFGGIVAVANNVTVTNNNTSVVTITGNLTGGNATSTWVNAANSTLNYGGAAAPMATGVLTANANPNTVIYSRAGNQAIEVPSAGYYNLTLNTSGAKNPAALTILGTFTMAGTVTSAPTGALAISGGFNLAGTGTFTAGAFIHNVGGALTNSGTVTVGTGTINVASFTNNNVVTVSTGLINVTGDYTNTAVGDTVTISNALGRLTVGGTLTNVGSIIFTGAGTVNANSDFTSSGIVTNTAAGILNIGGNATVNGTFTAGAGRVAFNGGSAQNASGTTLTFFNVTVSNASGVTLANSLTTGGTLTLTSGVVTTGANTLIVTAVSCATSVARTSGWVSGNLQKRIPANASACTFEVGGASVYAPITATFIAGAAASNITAKTTDGDHASIATSGLDPNLTANRSWSLINTVAQATAFSAVFNFDATDLDPDTQPATLFNARSFSGGAWATPITGARTATSTQMTGLTLAAATQKDFVVGEVVQGAGTGAGGFNVVENGANATTGKIYTKLAGAAFTLDLVALNVARTAVDTTFKGVVKVELLDSSSGGTLDANGCNAGWGVIQTLGTTPQFLSTDSGRKQNVSFTENKAWPNARVRVSYPSTGTATLIGCSGDNFSVRPFSLALTAAGLGADATGTSATATPAIKTGASFTLIATASDTGYTGTPTLDNAQLVAHAGAVRNGTLGGAFSAAVAGIASGAAFTYDDAGYFKFNANGLLDATFTAVDNTVGDCTADFSTSPVSGKYGCKVGSAATAYFGRFIPDHFDVTVNSNGTMSAACSSGGFTYTGQAMGYGTAPSLTIKPMNAATGGSVTKNYQGVFQKLTAANVTITAPIADGAQNGQDGLTRTTLTAVMSAGGLANSSGTLTYTLAAGDQYTYTRDANSLVGAYTSNIPLVVASVSDGEISSAGALPTLSPAGVSLRFGRLKLSNAYGSELLDLPIPIETQYWNSTAFVTNSADNCTTIQSTNIALVKTPSGCTTTVSGNVSFNTGLGNLKLTKPGAKCTADITVNLAAESPSKAYLQGKWSGVNYDQNPTARATFGVYKGNNNFIYLRENY